MGWGFSAHRIFQGVLGFHQHTRVRTHVRTYARTHIHYYYYYYYYYYFKLNPAPLSTSIH